MTKTITFFIIFVGISESEIICPKQSWTPLKNVTEKGSWSFLILTNFSLSKTMVQVDLHKTMQYQCRNEDAIELSASQGFRYSRQDQGKLEQKLNFTTSVETCKLDCNNTANRIGFCNLECIYDNEVPLTVKVRYRRGVYRGGNREWEQWEEIGQFPYFYKNCNKLYWSSWTETSNCSSSALTTFARSCADCNGNGVQPKYCEGNFTKQTQCQPLWGPWGKAGPCEVIACSSTGERVRSRRCLYGDGSESADPQLCSNQPAIMKEQCNGINYFSECKQFSFTDFDNISVYVYICVGVGIFFIFGISLSYWCGKKRRSNIDCKTKSTTANALNIEHHVYDQIQKNKDRDGRISPQDKSTLTLPQYCSMQQYTNAKPAPNSQSAQTNYKPPTTNQSINHLQPEMLTSTFLGYDQTFSQNEYELPTYVGLLGAQTQISADSAGYVILDRDNR